eukprot:5923600-Amphidinium_carterae.1
MFEVQKRFPMLKGKASEVKHFVPVALRMAVTLFTSPTEVETLMIGLLEQSNCIDAIVDGSREQFALRPPQALQLREAIMQYNLLTSELRFRFGETLLFNYTIKNHVLQHLAEDSQLLHPRGPMSPTTFQSYRLTWGYASEDFMMKVRSLAYGCKTMDRFALLNSVLRKYTFGLDLLLTPERRLLK